MASTGKRRAKRAKIVRKPKRKARKGSRAKSKVKRPRKGTPKRAKRVPAPAPTRTRARTRKPAKRIKKRAPKKRVKKRKRRSSAERARYEAQRRARAAAVRRARREAREGRVYGTGDVEVIDQEGAPVSPEYRSYPIPEHAPDEIRWAEVPSDQYRDAMDWLEGIFGPSDDHVVAIEDEIEWFPTFDEVYDYIDALVEEYDLDAHELFELAFGYKSDDAA